MVKRMEYREKAMHKETVKEILDSFPDDVDIDAFMERIYLQKKIDDGERDVSDGRLVAHEDAKQRLAKWLK